jgi:hypothetical protein
MSQSSLEQDLCFEVAAAATFFRIISAKTKIITKISYIVAWFLANINVWPSGSR